MTHNEPCIFFRRDLRELRFDGAVFCVFHKDYADRLPAMPDAVRVVEWEALRSGIENEPVWSEAKTILWVGTNHIFDPGKRVANNIWSSVRAKTPGVVRKVSVDTAPYVGDLYRLWIHWRFCQKPWDGHTYSYQLESQRKGFLDGVRADDPMGLDKIERWSAGVVDCGYDRWFGAGAKASEARQGDADGMVEDVVRLSAEVHAEYQVEKARLFDAFDSIGPILKGLTAFAKAACAKAGIKRNIPTWASAVRAGEVAGGVVRVVRSDLKVDEYLAGLLRGRMREMNDVARGLSGASKRCAVDCESSFPIGCEMGSEGEGVL